MVAIPLIHGRLVASDYENEIAHDPRVDALRSKMQVVENVQYTKDYFDPELRYIGNAIQIIFKDGTSIDKIAIDYPIGHRKRRDEGIPVLVKKFQNSLIDKLSDNQFSSLDKICENQVDLENMTVLDLMAKLVR
jgi:2-methylcitrate dehydratase